MVATPIVSMGVLLICMSDHPSEKFGKRLVDVNGFLYYLIKFDFRCNWVFFLFLGELSS